MSARVRRNALQARGTRRENPCAYGRVASESLIYDNQDRIVGYGSNIEYEFTDNGELLSRTDTATNDVTSYDYDAVGNLRSVVLPNGDEIEYLVDGQGRRVGRLVNGVFEKGWLWRGGLQPVAELDGSGAVAKRFVYGGGVNAPELMVTAAGTYRLVKDHLGSVRFVIDVSTGAAVQELAYDAWGRVVLDTNPGFQPCGFAGGLYEAETGLVRFGVRDYDAEIGRWTAKDPIRFDGGINLYEYVDSNPVNRRDPRGLWGDSSGGQGSSADDGSGSSDSSSDEEDYAGGATCEEDPVCGAAAGAAGGGLFFLFACSPPPDQCPSDGWEARCNSGHSRCMDSRDTSCCDEELVKCKSCDPKHDFRCGMSARE